MATSLKRLKATKAMGVPDTWDFADVYLVSGDARFACHKVKLAEQSKRFKYIFDHKEFMIDDDGVKYIPIDNTDSKTLEKILRFIYEGKVEKFNVDGKLLVAAEDFKLHDLIEFCIATIPNEYTLENVCETMEIAYKHGFEDLKSSSFVFVWDNLEFLAGTEAFKKLLLENPTLMTDILIRSKRWNDDYRARTVNDMRELEKEFNRKLDLFDKKLEQSLETKLMKTVFVPQETFIPYKGSQEGPFCLGRFAQKAGKQRIALPKDLPTVKAIRIYAIHHLPYSGSNKEVATSRLWTGIREEKCLNWLITARFQTNETGVQCQDLVFMLEDDKNIYGTLGHTGASVYPQIDVYLLGYWA